VCQITRQFADKTIKEHRGSWQEGIGGEFVKNAYKGVELLKWKPSMKGVKMMDSLGLKAKLSGRH